MYARHRVLSTFQRLPQIVRLFLWLGSRKKVTGTSSQHFETQVHAQGQGMNLTVKGTLTDDGSQLFTS